MKRKYILGFATLACLIFASRTLLIGQAPITGKIIGDGEHTRLAVIDFKGSGAAQGVMKTFNDVVWSDLSGSGLFDMVSKSVYPLEVPQQPSDIHPPAMFSGWTDPKVNASFLGFGYSGVQDGQLILSGNVANVRQPDVATALVMPTKLYFGPMNDQGARKVAHEYAADILKLFGGTSLLGTKIYFASTRSGAGTKELWSMDYDGANQKRLTNYNDITAYPAVSADGSLLAVTTWAKDTTNPVGRPQVRIFSTETMRRRSFSNLASSMVASPEFTPDGKKVLFSASVKVGDQDWPQLWIANVDGSGMTRMSNVSAIETEPKINPKNPNQMVFTSGRSRRAQIWKMNLDGSDRQMVTKGGGEAVNPAWNPDGQHIAFACTCGYEPGHYNIFVMDIATGNDIQLTHEEGKNENPSWAPDGVHITFSSTRSGRIQIYSMLANGSDVRQLTRDGQNSQPVWAKGIE